MSVALPILHGYFCGGISRETQREPYVKIIREPQELEEIELFYAGDGGSPDREKADSIKQSISQKCDFTQKNIILLQITDGDAIVCGVKNIARVHNRALLTIARLVAPKHSSPCGSIDVSFVFTAPKDIEEVEVEREPYDGQVNEEWHTEWKQSITDFDYKAYHKRATLLFDVTDAMLEDDEKRAKRDAFYTHAEKKANTEKWYIWERYVQHHRPKVESYYQSLSADKKQLFDELVAQKIFEQAIYKKYFLLCGQKLQGYMGEGTNFYPECPYLTPN